MTCLGNSVSRHWTEYIKFQQERQQDLELVLSGPTKQDRDLKAICGVLSDRGSPSQCQRGAPPGHGMCTAQLYIHSGHCQAQGVVQSEISDMLGTARLLPYTPQPWVLESPWFSSLFICCSKGDSCHNPTSASWTGLLLPDPRYWLAFSFPPHWAELNRVFHRLQVPYLG